MKRPSVLTAVFLALACEPAFGQEPINALWNDSNDGLPSFWIYAATGGCPDLRNNGMPLVFAPRTNEAKHAAGNLRYCFQLGERAETSILCQGGTVSFTFDPTARRYSGQYSFSMVDGSKKSGTFVAQYCPPAK